MSLFTCMASSNIYLMWWKLHFTVNDIYSSCISVGIRNEMGFCSAFIKSLCLELSCNILMYIWLFNKYRIYVVFFIVEYSFMSTLVWHLFMTSLKPVLNLPAAGVDIITILCHRWKPTVNYGLFLSPLLGDKERNVT